MKNKVDSEWMNSRDLTYKIKIVTYSGIWCDFIFAFSLNVKYLHVIRSSSRKLRFEKGGVDRVNSLEINQGFQQICIYHSYMCRELSITGRNVGLPAGNHRQDSLTNLLVGSTRCIIFFKWNSKDYLANSRRISILGRDLKGLSIKDLSSILFFFLSTRTNPVAV